MKYLLVSLLLLSAVSASAESLFIDRYGDKSAYKSTSPNAYREDQQLLIQREKNEIQYQQEENRRQQSEMRQQQYELDRQQSENRRQQIDNSYRPRY